MKPSTTLFAFVLAFCVLAFPQTIVAYSSTGTATVTINPGTSNQSAGAAMAPQLILNTGTKLVDVVQLIIDITGNVPSNITFNPATISGLQVDYNQINTTTTGKQLILLMVNPASGSGYTTNGASVSLGNFSFTMPTSGSVSLSFSSLNGDNVILERNTLIDIMATPTNATYTVQASATPTPTRTPTPQSSPTPTPVNYSLDSDTDVDIYDILILISRFTQNLAGDFNQNGRIDIFDFTTLIKNRL